MQRYLKQRMGCDQTIVTNIEYPGAITLELPPKFTPKHALFARYLGLRQVMMSEMSFPICLHDHDLFNAKCLPHDPDAILVASEIRGYFSEQAVVYPEISKQAILDHIDRIWRLDFDASLKQVYGTEVRHEGNYSTERTFASLRYQPFKAVPMRRGFNIKDQVSFDIVSKHSLDAGTADGEPILPETHAVHGHLNKGPVTDIMLNWLASKLA